MPAPRIAVVHEWLEHATGSEKVLREILGLWPQADLFCLVDFLAAGPQRDWLAGRTVSTSFIQRLPFARRAFRAYLPLMPLAVEQLDLSRYDVVISSSHAVAKGALTRASQLHISYVHTPIRYAWDLTHTYLRSLPWPQRLPAKLIMHYLRLWDATSARRPDVLVANSRHVARRIGKCWGREATVIHPPVAVERFRADRRRDSFFCVVSRLVPYKRLDLLVQAFTRLHLPLVVIGAGAGLPRLRRLAGPTVSLLGWQDDAVVADHLERCRAFVFAAEEDFGITLVEALAAGAPVIAYGRGGAQEIVGHGTTGVLYPEQTVDGVVAAVQDFIAEEDSFSAQACAARAREFTAARFRARFAALVDDAIADATPAIRLPPVHAAPSAVVAVPRSA
jgi:glycosyltransferase involved in cell wall biosynthesis